MCLVQTRLALCSVSRQNQSLLKVVGCLAVFNSIFTDRGLSTAYHDVDASTISEHHGKPYSAACVVGPPPDVPPPVKT